MKNLSLLISTGLFLFIVNSCAEQTTHTDISDSLDPVEDVALIPGTDNTEIIVRRDEKTYFRINFSNIEPNGVIENGVMEGWCIDWQEPIDTDGTSYENIQLFSTYNVEKWQPTNYLFSIIGHLKQEDPEITFREVQLAIWSLRGFPEFNLNSVSVEYLPSVMHNNGEPTFSYEKVNDILAAVEDGYRDFEATEDSRYAVIAYTPVGVQTVITVIN